MPRSDRFVPRWRKEKGPPPCVGCPDRSSKVSDYWGPHRCKHPTVEQYVGSTIRWRCTQCGEGFVPHSTLSLETLRLEIERDQAEAFIEGIRTAVMDRSGPEGYYEEMQARHRGEWPTLWDAIDAAVMRFVVRVVPRRD